MRSWHGQTIKLSYYYNRFCRFVLCGDFWSVGAVPQRRERQGDVDVARRTVWHSAVRRVPHVERRHSDSHNRRLQPLLVQSRNTRRRFACPQPTYSPRWYVCHYFFIILTVGALLLLWFFCRAYNADTFRLLYVSGLGQQQNRRSLAADISEGGRQNGTKFCR